LTPLRSVPEAERGLVIFLEDGGRLSAAAQIHRAGLADSARFSVSIVRRVASESIRHFRRRLQTDGRFADAQSIVSLGVSFVLLRSSSDKGGKALGVLQLERMGRGHQFTPDDLNCLPRSACRPRLPR